MQSAFFSERKMNMNCQKPCRLCDRLIISNSVTVVGDDLVVDIPAGAYLNCEKYCIVIAQAIPDTATINQPVSISIGGVTTTLYPLQDKCGVQLTASEIRTRTKYSAVVRTTSTGGIFRLLSKICNRATDNLAALPAPATAG